LGPTAYELVELLQIRSAWAYNIVAGHLIGLGAGFLAIYILPEDQDVLGEPVELESAVCEQAMISTWRTRPGVLLRIYYDAVFECRFPATERTRGAKAIFESRAAAEL
jgi:hypothetical protein